MKKWTVISKAIFVAIMLTACSQPADPVPGLTKEETENLTLEEVFANAVEILEKTSSVKARIETKQTVKQPSQDLTMESSSSMDMQMAMDPLAVYQKGTTTMTIAGSEEKQKMAMEMYMTEQGFFMKDEATKQWIKMPFEMYDQIALVTDQQIKIAGQMKQLKSFQDDVVFEQTKTDYVLKLSASGDAFEQLVKDQLNQFMPELQTEENKEATKKVLEQTEVQKVNYTVYIDKVTFETKLIEMGTKMTLTDGKETMNLHQTVKVNYSDYNKAGNITVPKDVVEKAQDMHF